LSNISPRGGGRTCLFPLGDRLWGYWAHCCPFFLLRLCLRISQNPKSFLRKPHKRNLYPVLLMAVSESQSIRRISLWPFGSGSMELKQL
jgi:hypothetical protein